MVLLLVDCIMQYSNSVQQTADLIGLLLSELLSSLLHIFEGTHFARQLSLLSVGPGFLLARGLLLVVVVCVQVVLAGPSLALLA